jgi:HOOK domain
MIAENNVVCNYWLLSAIVLPLHLGLHCHLLCLLILLNLDRSWTVWNIRHCKYSSLGLEWLWFLLFPVEHNDAKELGRLLQLVLGCAVNCDDKHEYIRRIMNLEESVQHDVMKAIQDVCVVSVFVPVVKFWVVCAQFVVTVSKCILGSRSVLSYWLNCEWYQLDWLKSTLLDSKKP